MSDVLIRMSRKQALEQGLLTCACGHPTNNHFGNGRGTCVACRCERYTEMARFGKLVSSAQERDAMRSNASALAAAKDMDDLRRDAGRYRKLREARSLLKLYIYDDPNDLCSGDWIYKPRPEVIDMFADGLGASGGEK